MLTSGKPARRLHEDSWYYSCSFSLGLGLCLQRSKKTYLLSECRRGRRGASDGAEHDRAREAAAAEAARTVRHSSWAPAGVRARTGPLRSAPATSAC